MASVRVWIQSPKAAFKFTRDMVEFTSFWVEGKEEGKPPQTISVPSGTGGSLLEESATLETFPHVSGKGSYYLATTRIF